MADDIRTRPIPVGTRVRLNAPVSRLHGYEGEVVREEKRQVVVRVDAPKGQPEGDVIVSKPAVVVLTAENGGSMGTAINASGGDV